MQLNLPMALISKLLNMNSKSNQIVLRNCYINHWCCAKNVVMGLDKTKHIPIGSQQNIRTIENSDKCLNLGGAGHKVEQVTDQKLLGVQIDNSLTWNNVKGVKKVVLFKLSLLKSKFTTNHQKSFLNHHIKPRLNYCCSIWGQTSQDNLITINRLPKQAARLVLDKG